MVGAKPFNIEKREVWEAFKRVKANRGSAGVDGQTIEAFEGSLTANLYKLWNRLSSGSYHPHAVRRVSIPKVDGGQRPLGIPTVADRIAQETARRHLEPLVEPHFHQDSYGYRPEKSAHDALRRARERCWRYDWVVDIDIKGFFDNLDHGLLLKAVRRHTDCAWVLLYIERWLKAPVRLEDGTEVARDRGVPQGGVISPLLANLYLHYVFDAWMSRYRSGVPFERYADDIVLHCRKRVSAERVLELLRERFAQCGLELHPEKTKIVYCRDSRRGGTHANTSFDFLGYTFRPRLAAWKDGRFGVSFLPAASGRGLKQVRQRIRGWQLPRRTDRSLWDLAREFNRVIRGWIGYYGEFYRSALRPTLWQIDHFLVRWVRRKFKRLRDRPRGAWSWLRRMARTTPS